MLVVRYLGYIIAAKAILIGLFVWLGSAIVQSVSSIPMRHIQ
jgi:hypothetical protein